MAKNVLITGCSGYFGTSLIRTLLAHPLVQRVVGVDSRPPALKPDPKFKYYPADSRDGVYLRNILEEENIDTIFHLSFLMGELPQRITAASLNIEASLAIAEAAHKAAHIQKLVIVSSAAAYGARRSNPLYLKEDAPLRASSMPYGFWKRRMEEEIHKILPDLRAQLQVSILRLCTVVTDSGISGPVKPFMTMPVGLSVLFKDCPMQFLAEKDLLGVMEKILEAPDFRGAYNVAPDDYTTLKTLYRKRQVFHLRLPYLILWLACFASKRLKPSWGLSEGITGHLAFPVVLDNAKLKRALHLELKTGSEATLLAYAQLSKQQSRKESF